MKVRLLCVLGYIYIYMPDDNSILTTSQARDILTTEAELEPLAQQPLPKAIRRAREDVGRRLGNEPRRPNNA